MTFQMCRFHGECLPDFLGNLFLLYFNHCEYQQFEKAILITYLDVLHFDLLEDSEFSNHTEWFESNPQMGFDVGQVLFFKHFSDEFIYSVEKSGIADKSKKYTDFAEFQLELNRLEKKYYSDVKSAKRMGWSGRKTKKLLFE
jgi:hypothetical protein